MPHRFRDNTRMNLTIVGCRGPCMAGCVRAQPIIQPQHFAQQHELLVEAAQGQLILVIGFLRSFTAFQQREKIRRIGITTHIPFQQDHRFRCKCHRQRAPRLPPAVSDHVIPQITFTQIGKIDKRQAAKQKH